MPDAFPAVSPSPAPPPLPGPVTSLLTTSGLGRRPSAEIDESPFDRRLGPLGGPPPKYKQYALTDFRLLRVLGKGAFGKVGEGQLVTRKEGGCWIIFWL